MREVWWISCSVGVRFRWPENGLYYMRTRLQFCLLAIPLTFGRAGAQEWTRFRGPNGTGISAATTVPIQFSEGDYNWKVSLPGKGHSSPVVWGKRIFLTSAEEDRGKRHMLCLSAADGSTLWDSVENFTPYKHHDLNTCASSSPTVDEKCVYFLWATRDGVVAEAWTHDGKPVWKRDLGKLAIQHGIGTSPVIVGNILAFSVTQEEE